METQRQKVEVVVRRPKGNTGLEIRKNIPVLKSLSETNCLPHDKYEFDRFKNIFFNELKSTIIKDFRNGTIKNRLMKEKYESLAGLERFYKQVVTFNDCAQARRIRMGDVAEKTWKKFVVPFRDDISDKEKIAIYEKVIKHFDKKAELDELIKYKNFPFAFEYKLNLNLDTEKAPAVIERRLKMEKVLRDFFGEGEASIISLLVPLRRLIYKVSKYKEDGNHIYGYQELLYMFGVGFSNIEYEKLFLESERRCKEAFDIYEEESSLGGLI